jgi:hypothetical protein
MIWLQCGYCSFNAAWGWADAAATIGGMIITFIINALFELWKIRIVACFDVCCV